MTYRMIVVVALCAMGQLARASLTLNTGPQVATPVGNLVTNGSFEIGAPAPGIANEVYWATGTTYTPFAVPPGWTSSGAASTYALWGSDGIITQGINYSAVLPDGKAGIYFGNGTMTINQTPVFHADGTVTFASAPTFSVDYGAPSRLLQSIPTDANPAPGYVLNFWVSGEEAVNPSGFGMTWTPGVFGLRVTNVLPGDPIQYLTVPSFNSANASQRFEYFFTPINPSLPVQVEFINWGHNKNPFATELVLDDVIVKTAVPEPGSAMMLIAGAAMLVKGRRRRG